MIGMSLDLSNLFTNVAGDTILKFLEINLHIKILWDNILALVVIGTDCIGSCKSNYHAITIRTMTAPIYYSNSIDVYIICEERSNLIFIATIYSKGLSPMWIQCNVVIFAKFNGTKYYPLESCNSIKLWILQITFCILYSWYMVI